MYRFFFLFILLLPLFGCTGEEEIPAGEQTPDSLTERITALEDKFQNLEQQHEQDVQNLQENMQNLMEYLQITLENIAKVEQGQDEGLGAAAKRSLEENLEKLRELSKEMIDKLEKELNESLQGEPEPSP